MILANDLSKFFGSFVAVKSLNFSISKGEIVGFIGPNGAGKTTTMRMMTGYLPASEGKIDLNGLIIRKEQKGYGANAWIEGKLPPKGSKVVVLEDVTTTGASAVKAVEKLRDAGYVVDRIITVVDRQVDGEADTNVLAAKCELISLFSIEELYE